MNKLSEILQLVELFYKKAMQDYQLWAKAQQQGYSSMPDDPEDDEDQTPYFEDLIDISYKVDDPGLSKQLQVLAELYKKALQIGGGYNAIFRAINNLKNMYSDGRDSDIENILDGMISELAKQAGGAGALSKQDRPEFLEQLQSAKQNIESEDQDKQTEAEGAYQEDINVPGSTGETEKDFSASGLSAEEGDTVAPAALGFGDVNNPAVNRGWHTTGKAGTYKNWAEYYNNEKEAYKADLAQSPDNANILNQLIKNLDSLSAKTARALELSDQQKIVADPNVASELVELNKEIVVLKTERAKLKNSIRKHQLIKEKQKLELQLSQTQDSREKELLEQKIALQDLAMKDVVFKAKERNARVAYIQSMSGGNFPLGKTKQDMIDNIEQSKIGQVPTSEYLQKHRKEQADKIKKQFKYEGTKRLGAIDLIGLTTQFRQSLPSIKMGLKKTITKKLHESENSKYKPYKDDIAAAMGDANAVVEATKKLMIVLNQDAENDPQIIEFKKHSENFYSFLKELSLMQEEEKQNKPITININNLILRGNNLLLQEKSRLPKGTVRKSKLVEAIENIIVQLQQKPSTNPL